MKTDIKITGIGSALQGVGRLPDGRAVFVPGALPDETVRAEILTEKDRFCEGVLLEVLTPSPHRVSPACPYTGACGGCQARHVSYEQTLMLKRQVVSDALTRIGGVKSPNVLETIGCDAPDRTRNKAEYPVARQDGRMVIGARAGGSHRVIPLKDCLLHKPESVRTLKWFVDHLNALPWADHLKYVVTRVNREGRLMVILSMDAPLMSDTRKLVPELTRALPELRSLWLCRLNHRPAHALDGACERLFGDATLPETLLGLRFEISPQSFFQVNPPQAERLYELALEAAGLFESDATKKDILDAYCGAGSITLAAARLARSAVGVEIVPPAIEDAKRNALTNKLSDKARFILGDAARELPHLLSQNRHFNAVILDPPRKGADEALLRSISAARVPRVAYVSCNPATLARDVKRLSADGYVFEWARPVDMFPWTQHVETVCCLYHQKKDFISVPYKPKDDDYLKNR